MESASEIEYEDVLKEVRGQGMSGMLPLYRAHRDSYLAFTRKYTSDRDVRLQSYNDAIIKLYKVIIRNKFNSEESQIKTYLFNLGKNNLINKIDKQKSYTKRFSTDTYLASYGDEEIISNDDSTNHLYWKSKIDQVFHLLGEKCQQILIHFYHEGLDADEIKAYMEYDSVNVVYSAKSRCVNKLRQLITDY